MYPEMSLEEAQHYLLPQEDVIGSYVVENPETHKITDFISFFHIQSSVIDNKKYDTFTATYCYYYANTTTSLKDLLADGIIAAKNDAAHQYLSAQLADHTLARTYECIVVGSLREDRGTVDAPIARHPADRKRMAVVAGGREAVTHWEVIARYPGYTHVRCRLETGRTHQIRVHMAYIGYPILGDTVYGAKKEVPGLTGQCLHAVGLRFLHPRTHEVVELSCPLPEEFTRMLQKIRK